MKCSKCGEELQKDIKFCPNCGEEVKKEEKNSKKEIPEEKVSELYCPNCGKKIEGIIIFCPECGQKINESSNSNRQQKSKIAAGLLGIFLGSLGIHNFYLGYNSKGITQLLLTLVGWIACFIGPLVAGIWGLVEGILILAGSITEDANGNRLQD